MAEFLAFEFELTDPLGPAGPDEPQAALVDHVVGDFRLFAGPELVYRDADFPLLELVLALAKWLAQAQSRGGEFAFVSRSSAVGPLFRFLRGYDGWHVSSMQRPLPSSFVFSLDELVAATAAFVAEASEAIRARHGFHALGS
jgi:hypothetical protein